MASRSLAKLAASIALVAAPAAFAQDAEGTLLDAILVTDPEDVAAAPAAPGTSVTGRETLQSQYQGAGIATVLNGFAGVTTETTAGDPALAVNIRGLQGNGRVVVTLDGARQNFAKSGHGANGTFYADPEMLREVEVVRGPAGVDAAAGAIGGTLALRTVTADDLIAEGETEGTEARLRFGTLTAEPTAHLAWARQLSKTTEALLAFTSSSAADYHAGDGTLVQAANDTLSSLGKLSFAPDDLQDYTLSFSQIRSDFVDGANGGTPRKTDMVTGTLMLDAEFGSEATLWQGRATLYRTTTRVEQQLLDDAGQPTGPERSYQTATNGLRATADSAFSLGRSEHEISLVLDAFRDGVTTDDPTAIGGSLTPSGNRQVVSLLAEDGITLAPGTMATIGLRADSYQLQSPDGSADGSQLSPALTLSQELGALTLFATLAQAYRPPTLSEALVNGQHPEPADFYIRPNPDLAPESSVTREIGAMLALEDVITAGDSLQGQITAYRNSVEDYIGLVRKGGLFDGYYQYDNLRNVRLEGVELELGYDSDRVFAAVSGQITQGLNLQTGEAVSGIAPNRAVITAGVYAPDGLTQYGARLTTVAGRRDAELSSKAWRTLDVFVNHQLGDWGEIGLALNNITDASYTQYLNTQPSPGFNALASLTLTF